jgi:hypothetical protein
MSGMRKGGDAPRKSLRNDVLLILSLLLILALVGACLILFQKKGDWVQVSVNGAVYGTYSLGEEQVVDIVTEAGCNRLVIRAGKAFVESADCPDGICVAHRPIFRNGESIVCLPNRVVITVTTATKTDTPDVVI